MEEGRPHRDPQAIGLHKSLVILKNTTQCAKNFFGRDAGERDSLRRVLSTRLGHMGTLGGGVPPVPPSHMKAVLCHGTPECAGCSPALGGAGGGAGEAAPVARSPWELRGPPELRVCDSGDADFALQLSVAPVISVPNRRGPHFLLSAVPTTRSFHKAARGAWLREGQSVFVTRE